MNLFDRLGFNAPQASSTAQPIGQDEFGRTIYRDSTGATYAMGSQPVQRTDAQRNDQAMIDAGIFPPDPADPRAAVNALATSMFNGFTAPGNALRGQPVTLGDVWETAGTAALGSQAMPAPENSLRAFNVYHGSPHDFDRFSMDKIGTGEGAQAYGHGLYFADNEGVARSYRDALSGNRMQSASMRYDGGDLFDAPSGARSVLNEVYPIIEAEGSVDGAMRVLRNRAENSPLTYSRMRAQDLLTFMEQNASKVEYKPKGRMYEVQIDANPEDFLDWDAPLSAQPRVAEKLGFSTRTDDEIHDEFEQLVEKYGHYDANSPPHVKSRMEELQAEFDLRVPNSTGQQFYSGVREEDYMHNVLSGKAYQPEQSEALRAKGIPGIRYLDAGSRGAGDGSRNYVVFDENLISIVRKYGWAAAAPMLAQMGMTPEQAQAQYEAQNGS